MIKFRIGMEIQPLSNWERVLDQLKTYDPNDGNFYILTTNKGTDNESRSRFLSHQEALLTINYLIEKNKK